MNENNSKKIPLIAIIGIIILAIIIVATIIIVASSRGQNSGTTNNTVTEKPKEDDDFFNDVKENKTKNETSKNKTKEYEKKDGVDIKQLYDSTGNDDNKLHIGDFVDYTAGKWTQEEIEKIDANGQRQKPSNGYQFGGYAVGMSRDGNAVPCNEDYSYIKEKVNNSNERSVTGWRIFDITDDEIILISAGCPEDYYHPEGTRSAYISEYILNGEVNSNINADWLGLGTKYKNRTWEEYVNSQFFATRASVLTKEKLDEWYSKYITKEKDADVWKNPILQKVYNTTYENIIDNYSYYWLATSYNDSNIFGFFPEVKAIGNSTNKYGNVFGIRVLIHLPIGIKFKEKSIGTKIITSRDNSYNYNIWEISR